MNHPKSLYHLPFFISSMKHSLWESLLSKPLFFFFLPMTLSLFFLLLPLSLFILTSTSHKFKLQLHHHPTVATRSDNLTRIFIHQYLKGLRFFHPKIGFSSSKPHHYSHSPQSHSEYVFSSPFLPHAEKTPREPLFFSRSFSSSFKTPPHNSLFPTTPFSFGKPPQPLFSSKLPFSM